MNLKIKYAALLAAIIFITAIFFVIASSMITKNVNLIRREDSRIKKLQDELNSAQVLNQDLKDVASVITNSLTENRELSNNEANEFIREFAEFAKNHEIAVHGITPRPYFAENRVLEQQFAIDLECTYVQLGQYLANLERYEYIIKVNSLDLRPQTDKYRIVNGIRQNLYKVMIDLSVFKIVKEA